MVFAAAVLTCVGFGQNEASQAAGDDAALAVEFQQSVGRYLALDDASDDYRANLDQIIADLDGLLARSGDEPDLLLIKALCHARRALLILKQRREVDRQYTALKDRHAQGATDELNRQMAELAGPRLELAEQVADEYTTVDDVLARALARADAINQEPAARLIRGVVLTQSAIVNDRALESAEAARDAQVSTEGVGPRPMRPLLDQAQALLARYLQDTPKDNGLEWIRGQFYLGVVEYRRSLVDRAAGREYRSVVDLDRKAVYDHAREIFGGLSDPAEVLAILKGREGGDRTAAEEAFARSNFATKGYSLENVADFYAASANLYLGLIASVDPTLDRKDPGAPLAAARRYLESAKELDGQTGEVGGESLTDRMIPASVDRVLRLLQDAAVAEPEPLPPLNDLTISMGMTTLYDTNVPLLGRNTAAPLHKDRKRDFRVGALFKLNYVLDLDSIREEDRGGPLSKWQLLFEARTSPTWNARIHDFNEQYYGATINLRYEIAAPSEGNIDAVYYHTRYDYDYFMLGNDGFLRVNRIRPSLQIIAFDQLVDTSIYFSYEDRDYLEFLQDMRFDRDGNYFSWGVDTFFDLGEWANAETMWGADKAWGKWAPNEDDADYRRPLRVSLAFGFTTNSTQGEEFDYSSQLVGGGVSVPMPYGVDFSAGGVFEWQDYRGNSLVDFHRRGRKDFIQEYGFRLERAFYLTRDYDPQSYQYTRPLNLSRVVMTLSGDIKFVIDDSNVVDRLDQKVFEYNRIIYGAGVRFDIN